MIGLVSAIKYRSARALRRALLTAIGSILVVIGAVFLTSAAWIMLAQTYSALFAALILAGIFLGLGLIFLGVASATRYHPVAPEAAPLRDPATPPVPGAMSPLAEAFLIGLNAALAARGRR
ncbi:hypothetical protein ACEWPL_006035 [Roseovarius sp. S1116L3]|uniref:hypothetical protein n=1 Tax=Roseovarius roseus TaxID=3342636 RepID=UPI00372C3CB4